MKCAACSIEFNDGVQCGLCKKHYDFGCVSMTEAGWRKLGTERRALWKCVTCRTASPSPSVQSTPEPVSNETILCEIRELKAQLAGFTKLQEDVQSMREELGELKKSFEFDSSRVEEFAVKLNDFESRIVCLEALQHRVDSMQSEIDGIKSELSSNDQRSRLNNVEIKGIPLNKDENLFSILETISEKVNYTFPRTQINYISRIPLFNSKEKSIVVSFLNRYIKEDFIAAARALKGLTIQELGYKGPASKVYINDHLNSSSKKLLNMTRTVAKEKDFKHVWVKHGKIHVRKLDGSHVFVINNEKDLNKLL